MEYYWIIYFVVAIINSLIFGFVTATINQSKGYDGGFAWGFFLGPIGIIVVACKPSLHSQSSNSSYSQASVQRMIQDEAKKEVQRILEEERNRANTPPVADLPPQAAPGTAAYIEDFLARAEKCSRISEVFALWQTEAPCQSDEIHSILKEATTIEKMYGVSNVSKTLKKIEPLLPVCPVVSVETVSLDTIVVDKKPPANGKRVCRVCQTEQPDYHTFCYHCGTLL